MDNKRITEAELQAIDPTFVESSFISKVDNIFIMLHSSVMLGNLERIKHKLSDELINRYQNLIDNFNANNIRQMYDELNVKSTMITGMYETENEYIIEVLLVSRYMNYLVTKDTNQFISGNNSYRTEKNNYLTFSKKKNAKVEGMTRKCPGCNANIDSNSSGKCPYCGTFYDTVNYDWILKDIR